MLPMVVMAFGVTAAVAQAQEPRFTQQHLYAKLFQAAADFRAELPGVSERQVVCGMRLIPADPNIDPQIRIVAPSTPDHKIRAIRPPVCGG